MQYFLKDEMLFEAVLRETFYTWTPETVWSVYWSLPGEGFTLGMDDSL